MADEKWYQCITNGMKGKYGYVDNGQRFKTDTSTGRQLVNNRFAIEVEGPELPAFETPRFPREVPKPVVYETRPAPVETPRPAIETKEAESRLGVIETTCDMPLFDPQPEMDQRSDSEVPAADVPEPRNAGYKRRGGRKGSSH